MNESTSSALVSSENDKIFAVLIQKLQNESSQGSTNDYMHSRSVSDYHSHNSFIAVIVLMTLFLIVTITTTGFVLAFCRKKNTVFALQKCEQESEYELDDMDNTDTEMCSEEYEATPKQAIRSRTFPTFSNVKNNPYPSSPSRTPLVNKSTQLYNSNSDDTLIVGENVENNGIIRKIHRSHTVGILYSSSKNTDSLCQKDHNCDTALLARLHSNPSVSISMDDDIHDKFEIREGTLQFLDLHTIARDEDGKYINV